MQGLLLVATDGFCNYVQREQMLKDILWIDFVVLAKAGGNGPFALKRSLG